MLILPMVLLPGIPSIPNRQNLPILALIGITDVLYLIPYYKSLQTTDTSAVTSLFSISRILVPLLAYLLVGERLRLNQYFGFGLIVLGSVFLVLQRDTSNYRIKTLFYMFISSSLLSLEIVLLKSVFRSIQWRSAFFWTTLISILVTFMSLLFPEIRRQIINYKSVARRRSPILVCNELLAFGGTISSTYAISLAPVTLVRGITAFQPFIVMLYALIFRRFFPQLFRENTNPRHVLKKAALFVAMACGVLLTLHGSS